MKKGSWAIGKMKRRNVIASLLLSIGVVSLVAVQLANAFLVTSGPTTSTFGYVVSKTTDVNIDISTIGLYFDTNTTHTVTIANGQLCDFGTSSTPSNQMGDLATAPLNTVFNTFTVYRTNSSEGMGTAIDTDDAKVLRRASDTTGCTTDDITLTIPSGALTKSTLTGKYVALLRADVLGTAPSNNQNTFRVSIAGGVVGVVGANNSDYSIVRSTQAGYNFNPAGTLPRKSGSQDVYFGTPCGISSNTTAYIHLYDIDNDDGAIQNGKITMGIYDLTDAAYEPAANVSGFQATATPNIWTPTTGSQVYATLRFTAQPNHKYRVDFNNQDNYNTVQMTLPYNSIYADINCANVAPELDPSVSLSPSTIIQVGDIVTGTFSITEVNGISSGIADYARRLWIENGTNATFDAGDVSIGAASGTDYTLGPGASTSTTITSGAITGGNSVCGSYELTGKNTASGMTIITASNPEVVCVPIGKYPKLQVKNGDIWVGGGLAGSCTVAANQDSIYGAPNNGSLDASYGGLGVVALGNVTQFGSAGMGGLRGLNNPDTAEILTYASTSALNGSFYGSAPVTKCLTDPSTLYGIATTAGGATIGAQTLGAGGVFERHYAGDITINGNITYQNTAYAINKFPRAVVISDGDIIITNGVSQLDGIYIARGNIYTCNNAAQVANVKRGGVCDNKLQVNGALFAGGRLVPWRAGGAIAPSILDKAETIDLKPSTYYGECVRVCNDGMRTVTQQEAPVRF